MSSARSVWPRLQTVEGARELLAFCLVGASGYVVNLVVYAGLLQTGIPFLLAAAGSFAVAVTNNYTWNRRWTFRHRRGGLYAQGLRFLIVSLCSLGGNLVVLQGMVGLHADKLAAQAIAIVLVTPLNFFGSKLWAFARPSAAAAA
jgi:putative flippase GtrA